MNKKKFDWYSMSQRFSIRKYHFGAASVVLGTLLSLGMSSSDASASNTEVEAEVNASEVTSVGNTEGVTSPVNEEVVNTTNVSDEKATKLASRKESVINSINVLKYLSAEQKAEFVAKAEKATSIDEVLAVQSDARAANVRLQLAEMRANSSSSEENSAVAFRAVTAESGESVSPRAATNATKTNQNTPPFDITKAIYSPGTDMQKQGYQGKAWVYRDGDLGGTNSNSVMLGGVKVYLQWVNGKGVVSPVYYTTTNADGTFVIDLSKPVVDATGATHKFQLAGDGKFAIRTWVENPDSSKYNVIQHGDKVYGFHSRLDRKNESWDITAGINRIVNSNVILQEKPFTESWLAKPETEWTTSGTQTGEWAENGNYGTLRGDVWFENGDAPGTLATQWLQGGALPRAKGDVNATGVKVVASYVNDEVARLFDAWKKSNPNYKLEDFAAAQKQIVEDYQKTNGVGSHIAETVVGVVKSDGSYYIPFRGLYGVSRTQQNSGLKISWKVSDEEYGKVVSDTDVDNNSLLKWNGTIGQKHRHINSDYVYAFPLIEGYAVWSNNYQTNMFQSTADVLTGAQPSDNNFWQRFALLALQPNHDVLVYDTETNKATPGTTVESTTSGLMPNREHQIQWFKDGVAIGSPTTVTADNEGKAKSVPITVDPNLSAPAIYTSGVFLQGVSTSDLSSALALDSFVADVAKQADTNEPKYEDKTVVPGTPAKSTPTYLDADGNPTTAPSGTKYGIDPNFKVPDGYTVTIDENTGEVTVTAPANPTKDTAEKLEVPVVVTYPDKSVDNVTANFFLDTDGDGTPDETDTDDDNDGIPDTDENTDGTNPKNPNSAASKITPIDDQTVELGNPIKEVTVVADKVPTGGSIKVEGLPGGVTFDPNTNTISGIPTTIGESTVTVTVLDKAGNPVTGANGQPVTEEFKITVTEKAKTDAAKYDPEYPVTKVVPGTPAKSTPTIKGEDGSSTTAPSGTKYKLHPFYTELSGYKVEIDENTGVVTVTAPGTLDLSTLEELDVPVVVTYPDMSEDDDVIAKFLLDTDGDGTPDKDDDDDDNDGVKDTDEGTDRTNPKDPNSAASKITPIDDQTIELGNPIQNVTVVTEKVPTGGSIKVDGLPGGVTFNPNTNTISGTPTAAGESTVTVTVLDKDGNPVKAANGQPVTEEFKITVTEKGKTDAEKNEPKYEDKTGKPGEEVKVPEPKNENGSNLPNGSTFESSNPDVKVDPNTGEVTVKVPDTAKPGDVIETTITVTYPDGSKDKVPVKVTVTEKDKTDAEKNEPKYEDKTGKPGEEVKVPAPKNENGSNLPNGSTFESSNPDVKVDPNTGEVTVTIPETAKPGDKIETTITVTYPDGSTDKVPVKVTVTEKDKTDAEKNEPKYEDKTGKPGEEVKVPAPKNENGSNLPNGSTFESSNPDVKVDPNTGEVTVKVPDTAKPGDVIETTITVTYPDGSKDKVPVKVTVTEKDKTDAEKNEPKYEDKTGKPGEEVKVPAPKNENGSNLPNGSTFESSNPDVKVNPNTGEVTVKVPDTAKPGDVIETTITVTYPDGSKDKVPVKVTVTEKDKTDAEKNEPKYEDKTAKPGEEVKVPEPKNENGSNLPNGSTFESSNPDVKVDPNTGEVTVKVPDTAKPGDVIETTITVIYPDGSKDKVPVKVTVTEKDKTDAEKNEPKYEDKTGKPGETVKVPAPKNEDGSELPSGSTFESSNPDVKVDLNTGEVTVKIPDTAKPGDVIETTITVTYPDGSTDKVPVKVTVTNPTPSITPIEDKTVIEKQPIDPIKVETTDVPTNGTIEVSGLPGGLTYNPNTGEITGTPTITDWGRDEEERNYTVKVEIKDETGKVVATEDFVITVQRDTDGDKIPDVTDPDDDNDGYTDEEEKAKGTDPKDPNSKPTTPVVPGGKDSDSGQPQTPETDSADNKDSESKVSKKLSNTGETTTTSAAGLVLLALAGLLSRRRKDNK